MLGKSIEHFFKNYKLFSSRYLFSFKTNKFMFDGLYNYYSRNNTKRSKILVTIDSLLLIILLSFFINTAFKDQNLYYYTFSTIIQGFLALVALLGAVVVYKLQIIETELNGTRDRMENDLTYFMGQAVYSFSWIEAMIEARKILDNNAYTESSGNEKYIERIEANWTKLDKLSKERGIIRSKMVDFCLGSFLNIGAALIFLPISRIVTLQETYILGFILLILNVIISIFLMFFALGVVRAVMGYSFKL